MVRRVASIGQRPNPDGTDCIIVNFNKQNLVRTALVEAHHSISCTGVIEALPLGYFYPPVGKGVVKDSRQLQRNAAPTQHFRAPFTPHPAPFFIPTYNCYDILGPLEDVDWQSSEKNAPVSV
mgnify:CR=1 FL=1